MDDVKMVPIDLVDPPREMDRRTIDPEKVRELAESIREEGLLQAIIVNKTGDRYEVIAGHRRLLATRMLGSTEIRATVKEVSEREVAVLRAIENSQREDLTPIEKANTYKRLMMKHGMTRKEVARQMGLNIMTVLKYLKLLELPDYIQDMVDKTEIGINVAVKLNEIDDEELKMYYTENAREHGITIKVAELWVSDYMATKQAQYYTSDRGGVDEEIKVVPKPIYITCFCCLGPTNVMETSNVQICKDCHNQIVLSRKAN